MTYLNAVFKEMLRLALQITSRKICTPVDCLQFRKESENVKQKLCLNVIIVVFLSLSVVLLFRNILKAVF